MQVNQQVTGSYMDVNFTGIIVQMRALTVKTDGCFEYLIKLDEEISVFGEDRGEVLMFARFDGQPSSYTKYTDWIKNVD